MSRRLTLRPLRIAVLTGVAAGALLVPATAAFATDPTPTPSATAATQADKEALAKKKAEDARTLKEAEAKKAAEAQKTGGKGYPRGGVAAGEAPAQDDNTGTLIGSATGALLLAGAGAYVLRRRTTARREG
ncbi:sortase-dependent protein [Streptomyces sviceus]|uniref:sortase-dependent protein n=1 Tax=Streptomyces sviceus TaxID=285530 RepID=UPI0037FD4D13